MTKIALTEAQIKALKQIDALDKGGSTVLNIQDAESLVDLELAEAVDGPVRYRLTLWGKTALRDHEKS